MFIYVYIPNTAWFAQAKKIPYCEFICIFSLPNQSHAHHTINKKRVKTPKMKITKTKKIKLKIKKEPTTS